MSHGRDLRGPRIDTGYPLNHNSRFPDDRRAERLEAVVRRRFPAVGEPLDWLGRFAPARLTGTGACVFAAMPDEASAQAALAKLPGRWTGFVVRGLNRSPLEARRQLEQDLRAGRR